MQNLITVERFIKRPDWSISNVYVEDKLNCYSVEDEYRKVKVKGETCIPEGIYPLALVNSPKFSGSFMSNDKFDIIESKIYDVKRHIGYKFHKVISVGNVPDFQNILIHWGNTDDDTDGCLVVGSSIGVINGQQGVLYSKEAYKRFYKLVAPEIAKGGRSITYKSI